MSVKDPWKAKNGISVAFLRSIPFKLFLSSKIGFYSLVVVGFMEPKGNLQAFAQALKDQGIDSAVCLLATDIALSGGNDTIAHVETIGKTLALTDVLDETVHDYRIYTGFLDVRRNLELAERARPVLIQRKPLGGFVSRMRKERPGGAVFC